MSTEPSSLDEARNFEAFYEAERDGLFGAVCLITGNRFEAEEVVQHAFVRLWERWERVHTLEDPTGYLYRTAMNVFRSRRRRAAVALRRSADLAFWEDSLAGSDSVAASDVRQDVVRALGTLTARQRAALVLTELLDFTSEEAGRALGIRASTVRALASQARAALRQKMEKADE